MAVGLILPEGTKSLANTDPLLQTMDLSAHPYDFPAGSGDFIEAHNRRYGRAKPGNVMADVPGLHATTVIPVWLSEIAAANPGWFEANGLGRATGNLTPSEEEIHDAQAGFIPGRGRITDLLSAEHIRLFPPAVEPPKPEPEPPDPDPDRLLAEHLFRIEEQAIQAHTFLRAKGTQVVGGGAYARELRDLLKVIGVVLLAVLPLLLSGCSALKPLWPGGVTAADAEWDGVKLTQAIPVSSQLDPRAGAVAAILQLLGQEDPFGVLLPLTPIGAAQPRWVLCERKLAAKCLAIPLNAEVHFAGSPIGPGLVWLAKDLSALHFND